MAYKSVLYPPNFQDVKDRVVHNVVPSVSKRSNNSMHVIDESLHSSITSFSSVRLPSGHPPMSSQRSSDDSSSKNTISSLLHESQEVHRSHRASPEVCPTRRELHESDNNPSQLMSSLNVETPSSVEAAKLAFRRRRGRIHQARHRGKKQKGLQDLQESLDTLREEIVQLNTEKHLTSLYMSMDLTAMKVVAEYFRLFRFGVRQEDLSTSDVKPGGSIPVVQRCFLNAAMAPDVTDGTVVGVNAIMESWERMSLCFPGIEIEPTCLENGSDGSIVATTQQNLMINENMLHYAFPHLIKECGEYSQLVNKLLGRHILIRGSVCFKWDKENGRVSSFVFKADLVTPMLRLLDNLEDVSHVFSKARLTPECGLVAGL